MFFCCKGVKSIPTKDGRNILIDGFWGTLRHPNYTGDFMMNVAWSMICGKLFVNDSISIIFKEYTCPVVKICYVHAVLIFLFMGTY